MSSGLAKPGRAAEPCCPPESVKLPAPAFASGVRVRTAIPSFFAASTAGEALPASTTSALAPKSLM